jgi:hypothetical protein
MAPCAPKFRENAYRIPNEPTTGAHGLRSLMKRHAVSLVAFGTTVRTEALRTTFCESPTAPQMGQWGNVHPASVKMAADEAHRHYDADNAGQIMERLRSTFT